METESRNSSNRVRLDEPQRVFRQSRWAADPMRTFLATILVVFLLWSTAKADKSEAEPGIPVELKPFVVVSGNAQASGVVQYTPELTLLAVLTSMGGINDFNDQTTLYIIRKGKAFQVNLRQIRKDPTKDIKLEPWDILCIGSQSGLYGEYVKPVKKQ